jgi:hypothetical protein
MISRYEDLHTVKQDLYCISYIGIADGEPRLCYLMREKRPLFFFDFESANEYFYRNSVDTRKDDNILWWKRKRVYPDAKIVKVTLSNFTIAEEELRG